MIQKMIHLLLKCWSLEEIIMPCAWMNASLHGLSALETGSGTESLNSPLLPRWTGNEKKKDRDVKELRAGLWLHWVNASLSPVRSQGWRSSICRGNMALFVGQVDWDRRNTEQPRSDENNIGVILTSALAPSSLLTVLGRFLFCWKPCVVHQLSEYYASRSPFTCTTEL